MAFFTERDGALPPQTNAALPAQFIEAIANELIGLGDRWWLARGWPLKFQDDQAVVTATDFGRFWQAARGKLNLSADEPARLVNEPNRLVILNLMKEMVPWAISSRTSATR